MDETDTQWLALRAAWDERDKALAAYFSARGAQDAASNAMDGLIVVTNAACAALDAAQAAVNRLEFEAMYRR